MKVSLSDSPQATALLPELEEFVALTSSFSTGGDLAQQRNDYRHMAAAFTPPRPPGVTTEDRLLIWNDHTVPVRLYRPPGAQPASGWPAVCYLHGGGWVVGDLDSHDFVTAALAADLGAVVVAADYRLAPEHPFPAAFDDVHSVWLALQAEAQQLGLDARRLAVAGDSAGGNLAAALCLALRDAGEPMPCGQALVYPALAAEPTQPAYSENAHAPLLSAADVRYYHDLYLPEAAMRTDPRAAPLEAQRFDQLPPAFVAVAELDPLRDDGVEYVRRLQEAGVAAKLYRGAGLIHGCLRARATSPAVERLYQALVAALTAFLDG